MTTRIALIAHDHKKDDIVKLAGEYVDTLRRCDIVATGTTGWRIADAHGLDGRADAVRPARRRPADRRATRGRAAWTW